MLIALADGDVYRRELVAAAETMYRQTARQQ